MAGRDSDDGRLFLARVDVEGNGRLANLPCCRSSSSSEELSPPAESFAGS